MVSNLNKRESSDEVSKSFLWGIDGFKQVLNSKLAPKRSVNEAEFVTGEGKWHRKKNLHQTTVMLWLSLMM